MFRVLHVGNKCFKVVEQLTWDQGYNWADAQIRCKQAQGVSPDLASVQSAAENGSVAYTVSSKTFFGNVLGIFG